MPWKVVAACRHIGCPYKQEGKTGYCAKHRPIYEFKETLRLREQKKKRLLNDPQEKERHDFYTSKRWRRLRQLQLNTEPLCRECGAPGRVVDHIQQISRGGERYDQDNLQTLCDSCHNKKRLEESKREIKLRKTSA